MRDEHVISILESVPFADLGEGELAAVRAHAGHCAECRRAYEAAQISALLLRGRAAETIEPPPFFQTRVLAALRERQAATEVWGFGRVWKATRALVSSMAVTVAALAVLTVVAPVQQPEPGAQDEAAAPREVASVINPRSAEDVLLEQDNPPGEQLTYGQVLSALYESDEDAAR